VIEALVNLATNGALDRIDQLGKPARELYQWRLHHHHAKSGSPLDADNSAFAAAHPLALAGDAAATESLFPMMNASEIPNAAGNARRGTSKRQRTFQFDHAALSVGDGDLCTDDLAPEQSRSRTSSQPLYER